MAFPLGNEMSGSVAVLPQFCCYVAWEWQTQSKALGAGRGHHVMGMVVLELRHFSIPGTGLVARRGKVLRNWCQAQNQTETKPQEGAARDLINTWGWNGWGLQDLFFSTFLVAFIATVPWPSSPYLKADNDFQISSVWEAKKLPKVQAVWLEFTSCLKCGQQQEVHLSSALGLLLFCSSSTSDAQSASSAFLDLYWRFGETSSGRWHHTWSCLQSRTMLAKDFISLLVDRGVMVFWCSERAWLSGVGIWWCPWLLDVEMTGGHVQCLAAGKVPIWWALKYRI